jgi:hypothetical protein
MCAFRWLCSLLLTIRSRTASRIRIRRVSTAIWAFVRFQPICTHVHGLATMDLYLLTMVWSDRVGSHLQWFVIFRNRINRSVSITTKKAVVEGNLPRSIVIENAGDFHLFTSMRWMEIVRNPSKLPGRMVYSPFLLSSISSDSNYLNR